MTESTADCTEFLVKISEKSDLADAVEAIFGMQKTCPHNNVQRWGPSYTMRFDGSYRKFDSYLCKDCGFSSDEPIGLSKVNNF